MRPVAEIRADLEHPHTAALTALHSTTIGDGPIGRLLRDVEPLAERLAALYSQLAAAIFERDDAQRECAELWDALDAARMVIDEAQAKIRSRDQARARAQAVDVVAGADLAAKLALYLATRQHTLSTADLTGADQWCAEASYVVGEADELHKAIDQLCALEEGPADQADDDQWDAAQRAVRHELADVVLAATALAGMLPGGVTIEACIAEKTEADRPRMIRLWRRDVPPAALTVTITADTSKFDEAMSRASSGAMCSCGGELTVWCFDCGDWVCDDCGCSADHEDREER
jgi:NTP pyrophosphatase (non-canonical NTP hydrolase)